MIHQCLLVAWIVLAVTWFVWERWWLQRLGEGDAGQEVSLDADGEPCQPATISNSSSSHQQVSYLLDHFSFITIILVIEAALSQLCLSGIAVKRVVI